MKRKHIEPGNPPAMTEPKFPLLVSYAYLRKANNESRNWLLHEAKHEGIELLLDSGAFTAFNSGDVIELDEYMTFLDAHKSAFFGYIGLDVLQDPKATRSNLDTMYKSGFKPIPVHVFGDDGKRMDELFDRSDIVALGGLRRPHRGAAPKSYILQKMRWAKGRDVHWLGYTNQDMVQRMLPFSCDCNSWAYGSRFGWLQFYLGRGKWVQVHRKDKSKTLLTSAMVAVLEDAGFSKEDFYNDALWSESVKRGVFGVKSPPAMVNAMCWVRYIMDVRKKFGSRIFLAAEPARINVISTCAKKVLDEMRSVLSNAV